MGDAFCAAAALLPVSYTHLDVYKRQLHMHADDDALKADENDIGGVVDDLKPRDVAFAAVVPDSQAAAVLGSCLLYTSRCV